MTRQNFYQGQSVAPEHLNALQDYADSGHANLISSLLGYGIVEGFVVSPSSGYIVSVTSGLAFNMAGERLVLAEKKQVNLSQYAPSTGEKIIKLGIALDYTQSDPVQDSFGESVNTKWTPTVQFIVGGSLSSGVLELAEITINSFGVTALKNTGVSFTTLQKLIQNTSSMEIGGNENGNYIKFENGLLICTTVITQYPDYDIITWTYPYAFRSIPYYNASPLYSDTGNNTDVECCKTTYVANTYAISIGKRYVNGVWSVYQGWTRRVAIGFWK